MKQGKRGYYLGLDIGTDSIGYAVTDEQYHLLRFHGNDVWGSHVFDSASLCDERRGFRSARRRLDRRQQRVKLLQEIFAKEIANIDPRFFIRLSESYRWRDDTDDRYIYFNEEEYTDIQYMRDYPTIHHLICELMENEEEHDIRLVYLACAWLVAHRGHFLSQLSVDNIDSLVDIESVYQKFLHFFIDNGCENPWIQDAELVGGILKEHIGVTEKHNRLGEIMLGNRKPSKDVRDTFLYSEYCIIRLLAGGTCKLRDLYGKEEYEDFGSVSLEMDDDKLAEIMINIGEDYELIAVLRSLHDWSVLADILDGQNGLTNISTAKVAIYEQHKKDLATLKYFIRKYCPEKYNAIFKDAREDNYVAYSYHYNNKLDGQIKKKADTETFSKFLIKIINSIKPDKEDEIIYQDMDNRLGLRQFLPKQRNTDNRVIPHQLFEYELKKILENAAKYLPFLNQKEDGISNTEKIISIFKFKIPYYVGPLNKHSEFAWIDRKSGKILPWNYENMIDDDASEEAFIKKMTNQCTYLPGESVLPKDSLCYQKFMVLNEINNIKVDGRKISVGAKQGIYSDLFLKYKKVKRSQIEEYLISNGQLEKNRRETLSGIDIQIKSSLSSHIAFRRLLEQKILNEADVERIIERASYAEDKGRVAKWLRAKYPHLTEADIKYICKVKIKDFGRLSRTFLTGIEGACKETGEVATIISMMWESNDNLMELLSERYTFADTILEFKSDYYTERKQTLSERLDEMYVSNAVRRPIYRTLDIVKDLEKAFGKPEKIFIEMTRGAMPELKGKRTKSRQQQLLEYYDKCKEEDVRDLKQQLEALGEYVDNKLQSDRLFLYFMQFGKCAYSGMPISLERLMAGSKEYDIDHIYPQAYVKDDSIINNKVLVLSVANGEKKDVYPIKSEIRNKMQKTWSFWHHVGTISDEKYKRLIRSTPFTEDEKYGFINRQLTETSQSTKVVAELLKERYPEAEIVYSKAGLISDFRHEFDLYKSRSYNDLHHAVDAYLNIVVGNVYHMRFSRQWFNVNSSYSIKTKTLFTHTVNCNGKEVWNKDMLPGVLKTAKKNTAHFTKHATFKTGGLFDQNPVKKAPGLTPLKAGLPTEKYGGYNKAGVMFFIPVRYKSGKKTVLMVLSVELLYGDRFLEDEIFAKEYAKDRLQRIIGKSVDEIDFPIGMRPWKVNTILSLDGFRICITGNASGGKCLIAQPIMQFSSDEYWKYYLKKLEKFVEKVKNNSSYVYDVDYDVVHHEDNLKLYDLYLDKLQNSIYRKRINAPIQTLIEGREKFIDCSVIEQCQVLLNIHQVFGRMTSGCDLTLIGGKSHSAATVSFSSTISNWKKNYTDVRIIDQSASGLWEVVSENILEYL